MSRILQTPLDSAARETLRCGLRSGAVLAYPTESSYALGGNGLDEAVCREVQRIKGRTAANPLLLLIEGEDMLAGLARDIPPPARVLMERFWPGPLTLLFGAAGDLPPQVIGGRGTVALRWSPHPTVRELVRLGGVPLIGTSANRAGEPPLQSAEAVEAALGAEVGLIVGEDPHGAVPGGTAGPPSTLVDTTVAPFGVLREGALAKSLIQAALVETFIDAVPE